MLFASYFFGTPMSMFLILSILMVSVSLYMYNIDPEEDVGILRVIKGPGGGLDTLRSLSANLESDRLQHLEAGKASIPLSAAIPVSVNKIED